MSNTHAIRTLWLSFGEQINLLVISLAQFESLYEN
jgi:hypothetical protein